MTLFRPLAEMSHRIGLRAKTVAHCWRPPSGVTRVCRFMLCKFSYSTPSESPRLYYFRALRGQLMHQDNTRDLAAALLEPRCTGLWG